MNVHRLLLRNVAEEESGSGTYYANEGTCLDADAVLEIQGECDVIKDYQTCFANAISTSAASTSRVVGGGALWAVASALVWAAATLA